MPDPLIIHGRLPSGPVDEGFSPSSDPARLEKFVGYLTDESRMRGTAEAVVFPETEAEVALTLKEAARSGAKVTISAGRTGVVGGAVPLGGWCLSVERMNQVSAFTWNQEADEFRLRTGPGIPLDKLLRAIRSVHFPFRHPPDEATRAVLEEFRRQAARWIFAPDPTETTAQIGGMVAGNASGARTFAFGPTRNHVRAITVVLADGTVFDLHRGSDRARPGQQLILQNPAGQRIELPHPGYRTPQVKHAAGYFAAPEIDPIDLFIGSEGTLGVITEVELALRRVEGSEAEVIAFFPDVPGACRFVAAMRDCREGPDFSVEALEYLCSGSLALLQRNVLVHEVSNRLPSDSQVAVFASLRIRGSVPGSLATVGRLIDGAGGRFDESLAAIGPVDLRRVKTVRHALPENINAMVARIKETHPKITKLGTDMSVPDEHLPAIMEMYGAYLSEAGLQHYIFGHIGDNHLHVNIIPRDPGEYDRGRALYLEFARQIVAMGGSVSAEHGIGKLKKYLLETQFPRAALEEMRALKRAMDPGLLLGFGTLFDL